MRVLRPQRPHSRTGIITPQKPHLQAGGPTRQYKQPNPILQRIDSVLEGAKLHICIVRSTGGIGDVLMTLPAVRAVKKKYNCHLTYATDYNYLEGALTKVLYGNPHIDAIIKWSDLVPEHYDATIDLTCPCIAHEKQGAPPVNRIDLFARHIGVELDSPHIDFYLTKSEVDWGQNFVKQNKLINKKIILVQPFSSSESRDVPKNTLKSALAAVFETRRDVRAIICTHSTDSSSDDWKYLETVEARNLDIRQIASIMHHCDLVLCPDSSILHLAGALKKPTVSLFGPTDPYARVNHYPNAMAIWPGGKLAMSPIWYGNPQGSAITWKMLTPEMIHETVLAALNKQVLNRDYIVAANSRFLHFGSIGNYEII